MCESALEFMLLGGEARSMLSQHSSQQQVRGYSEQEEKDSS